MTDQATGVLTTTDLEVGKQPGYTRETIRLDGEPIGYLTVQTVDHHGLMGEPITRHWLCDLKWRQVGDEDLYLDRGEALDAMRRAQAPGAAAARARANTHACPGCNTAGIPNQLYACGTCWGRLPRDLQRDIRRTARRSGCRHPGERLDVLERAAIFYREQPSRR